MAKFAVFLMIGSYVLFGQVRITEVMYDPLGPERSDEFVEILNVGVSAVDLSGWLVGDSVALDRLLPVPGFGMVLNPGQFAVILDPDYLQDSADTYANIIPPTALLLMFETATFGSNGLSNSSPETVILQTAAGDTADSYRYLPGNSPGYSDERIDPLNPVNTDNWGVSKVLHGTPGKRNSLTPGEIDLSLENLEFQTRDFLAGLDLPFTAIVKNAGKQPVTGFDWHMFIDSDSSGYPDENEILDSFPEQILLAPGDSLELEGIFPAVSYGNWTFGAAVSASGDEDSANNSITRAVFIDDPGSVKVVINEIMHSPDAGLQEWIEIINNGSTPFNLRQMHLADARDTVIISTSDRWLAPGEFAILTRDTSASWQYSIPGDKLLIIRNFPNLNNDRDDLRLLGPSFVVYDHVPYTAEWFRRDAPRGTSLEKLHPGFDGQISNSWAAAVSVSGSTPAAPNSVLVNLAETSNSLDISPNPFSPDNDGFEDFAVIRFQLDIPTGFADVRIYDLRGRLVQHLAKNAPVAGSGQFVWDGRDDQQRLLPIGPYVLFFQIFNNEQKHIRTFKKTIILVKQ